jgi:hypothetical protein
MNKLRVALDSLIDSLNNAMDMTLFEQKETEEEFIFTIKEAIVKEELRDFLQFQFLLYNQEEPV